MAVTAALSSTDEGLWLLQDKVVSLLLSNYLLWPVTNHIMSKFVPKQHRAGATHVVTVCARISSKLVDVSCESVRIMKQYT